jgi:hypothetical protein
LILLVLKGILAICLCTIFYQDIKERAVWWFLFPVFLVTAGTLHFINTLTSIFFINIGLNLLLTSIILGVSYIYALLKLKIQFINEAFGLGDLLFFLGFIFSFPTFTFIILLVFSLLFSLGLHLLLSYDHSKYKTVPLAGYASLFLLLIYSADWLGIYDNLYFI